MDVRVNIVLGHCPREPDPLWKEFMRLAIRNANDLGRMGVIFNDVKIEYDKEERTLNVSRISEGEDDTNS